MGKLNPQAVTRATKPGMYGDGGGLYLQVGPGGAKSWIYRFTLNGKQRYFGLGSAAIPLRRARELAAEARQLRAEGIDPIEHRRSERLAAQVASAKVMTFQQCAEAYIAAHESGWHNPKHRAQWHSTLATYVYPVFGSLPVGEVNTGLVLQCLQPIWSSKIETASRLRGRVESILDWAKVAEYRSGENPARWRGHLDKLLPARGKVRKVEHYAALPYAQMPGFIAELRCRQGVSALALELTILCASRTGEAIGARWDEFDLPAGIWTIPVKRMKKSGNAHRVPLSSRAVEIIRSRYEKRESEFVFPGARIGQPLSKTAMLKLLELMGRADLTVHGFRSSFRDWAAECTSFPAEVAEMALAHTVGSAVEKAYRRGDLFEKRRALMAAWSDYCTRPADDAGKVVPFAISRG
jgi:integrase